MSRWEMKKVLEDAHASRSTHVSAVLHSFSGVKAKDLQYQHLRPDQIVRRRFTALLDYLAANQDRFRVSTVGELALEARSASSSQAGWIPSLGFFHPLARKLVQAVNSLY
jgi:hypothetical protein